MSITSTLFLGLCVGSLCIIAAAGNPLIDSLGQDPTLVIPEGEGSPLIDSLGQDPTLAIPEGQGNPVLVVPEGEIPVLGQPPVNPVGQSLGSYQPCSSDWECDEYSFCYFTYSDLGTCEPRGNPRSIGQPCLTLMDCGLGLYCQWLTDVDPYGHCAPLDITSDEDLYLQAQLK